MPSRRKIASESSRMLWKQPEWQPLGAGTMRNVLLLMTSASRHWKLWPREKPPSTSLSMNRRQERGMKLVSADNNRKRASNNCLRTSGRILLEWASSTRLHVSWALIVASKILKNVIERSCSRTLLMNCLIRKERTRGLNSKLIKNFSF